MILAARESRAETVVQSLELKRGWNAVFLEVEPSSAVPADAFAGVSGLESVWTWNRRTSAVQFIDDPGNPLEPLPYMLAYFPSQPALVSNLHAIHGEAPYLIHINTDTGPPTQTWTVSGQPAVPRADWKPNSFNLVGFHLDPLAPPNFGAFFAGSPAHAGQEIWRLDNATGTWVQVLDPATTTMKQGEAFWVYCAGSSTFAGPLAVQLELSSGLDFAAGLTEEAVVVKNAGEGVRTVSVEVTRNDPQLHVWRHDPQDPAGIWVNLFSNPLSVSVPGGAVQRLRLGVVRAGLTAGQPYEANLRLSDGQGMRIVLPVSVRGIGRAGLWVGDVLVQKVNRGGETPLEPVGSPFAFRALLHVDSGGEVRLLREVVQLWQDGGWIADPDNAGRLIPDPNNPGAYVLVATRTLLDADPPVGLRGSALRDGQEVGRRISTAAFGFDAPIVKTSGSFTLNGAVTFAISQAAGDSANPFLHQFNKDHLAAQSYAVTRTITFDLLADDTSGDIVTGVPLLSWGSTEVGGKYRETLQLQRSGAADPYGVKVEGTFRLRRVSDVDTLR
jgi:hypothetical protein